MAFSPRNGLLYLAVGDGGGGRAIPRTTPRTSSATSWARCSGSTSMEPVAGPLGTYSIPSRTRSSAAAASTRSGHTACATRGGSRSIAPTATSSSATSARVGYEEIDRESYTARGGRNYGWRVMEGHHCYNASSCSLAGDTLPGHLVFGTRPGTAPSLVASSIAGRPRPSLVGRLCLCRLLQRHDLDNAMNGGNADKDLAARQARTSRPSVRATTPSCTRSRSTASSSGCSPRRVARRQVG